MVMEFHAWQEYRAVVHLYLLYSHLIISQLPPKKLNVVQFSFILVYSNSKSAEFKSMIDRSDTALDHASLLSCVAKSQAWISVRTIPATCIGIGKLGIPTPQVVNHVNPNRNSQGQQVTCSPPYPSKVTLTTISLPSNVKETKIVIGWKYIISYH